MSSLTQTFVIENEGSFLMVRRSLEEEHYPGYWAFPGGRVDAGEIPLESMLREIKEETGLAITDQYCILDSYGFSNRSAYAFLVRSTNRNVILSAEEALEFEWISTIEEMQARKCIEGIHYHFLQAQKTLERYKELCDFGDSDISEVKQQQIKDFSVFRSIQEDTLTVERYPNKA
jgi:ADP-ribose pyrophosphatase YjhB (NUDIX family)